TDPANAPGRPSRLISRAASLFICSCVLVSPRAERFQDFCTRGNRNLNGSGIGGVPIIRPRARQSEAHQRRREFVGRSTYWANFGVTPLSRSSYHRAIDERARENFGCASA